MSLRSILSPWVRIRTVAAVIVLLAPGAGPAFAAPLNSQLTQPPSMTTPSSAVAPFEYHDSVKSLPAILMRQWQPSGRLVIPESVINSNYLRTIDDSRNRLTLKQAIYVALRNNPNVAAARLSPLIATESVKAQFGVFDPDLTANLEDEDSNMPITTPLEVKTGDTLSTHLYEWNFGVNKILASTNGTLGLTFNNEYQTTNNLTDTIVPSYVPTLGLSLSQPLLRNFGLQFATINVQLADIGQIQAQYQYASTLSSFVEQIGFYYWELVRAQENLEVAEEALRFNEDVVKEDRIELRVGTLAPLDLNEAQSAAAAALANVYAARAALESARTTLRQNVMLDPHRTFIPSQIEPAQQPNPTPEPLESRDQALHNAAFNRPVLGQMRQAIREALLQVRFQQNQLLPQLNADAQIAVTSQGGEAQCGPTFGLVSPNCDLAPGATGYRLPFTASYGDTLGKMFDFTYYSYTALLSAERPLENANARAALAQQRIAYEQTRMEFRGQLSQVVADVLTSLSNLAAYGPAVQAALRARGYAEEALHDETARFRVGMATTHDLLQYQASLVQAQGNAVQTEVGLEEARLAFWHAEGTLLRHFNIVFQLSNTPETPWFARF